MAEVFQYEGQYLHGVQPGDWYPAWNLSLWGRLISPDFLALCDPGIAASHVRVRDVPLEQLTAGSIELGAVSPRAARYVAMAAIIRNGGHVGIGSASTQWLSRAQLDHVERIGDIELEFERIRREVAPEAVSRLACLWVADNSRLGEAHIRNMLGLDAIILKVRIPAATGVTPVDTAWFDTYVHKPNPDSARRYWMSEPKDPASPRWEYLVDGLLESNDSQGLQRLREQHSREGGVREREALTPDIAAANVVMICGSMAMLKDTAALVEGFGFEEGSNAKPAGYVIEKAFVG